MISKCLYRVHTQLKLARKTEEADYYKRYAVLLPSFALNSNTMRSLGYFSELLLIIKWSQTKFLNLREMTGDLNNKDWLLIS